MHRQLLCAALAALVFAAGTSAACAAGKAGCKKCDARTGKCLECAALIDMEYSPAYGLTKNGTCTKCKVSGETAEMCVRCNGDAPTRCIECKPISVYDVGVYLRRDGTCKDCNGGFCERCSQFTGTCEACFFGHALLRGKCVPCEIDDCVDCSGNTRSCKKCDEDMIFDAGTCKRCADMGLPECYSCMKNRTGRLVCTDCEDNYGVNLKTGRCVKCLVPNCLSCRPDATKCTECSFQGLGGVFMGGKCQRCDVVVNKLCGSCALRGGKPVCTICKSGFGLKNGQCVPCKAKTCSNCGMDSNVCNNF